MQELILKVGENTITIQMGEIYSISSDLKKACHHCEQDECYFTCEKSQIIPDCQFPEIARAEDEQIVESRRLWNTAMDAILSVVLAHAKWNHFMVCEQPYRVGIAVGIEKMSKNLS